MLDDWRDALDQNKLSDDIRQREKSSIFAELKNKVEEAIDKVLDLERYK